MVNGDLEITLEGALGKQATFAWKPTSRPNSPTTNAGMLLFRHGDEHGHPVLLEGELFPIGFREGSSVQKDSTITATEWEWTNRAVCVYKEDGDISVEVRAIDPLKIRTYDNPDWWLHEDGFVWPAKKPPAELHGVAKGLFVNLAAGLGISAGSTLKTEVVRQADGSLVFANTTLKLPIGGNPMCIQPEERHYSPGTHEAPAETAVGFRLTQAKSGAVVSLPAIDHPSLCQTFPTKPPGDEGPDLGGRQTMAERPE